MNRTLWVLQWLLAIFFVLASAVPKLFVPPELLPPMPIPIPRWFVLFVGVAEVLGGLGLILPGLFRIRPGLTPLAAGGLVLVTIGATVYQMMAGEPGNAIFALVLGGLCAFVGYGRWQLVPHRQRPSRPVLQLAR